MLAKVEEWILVVCLIVMSILGVYQVATRYVFTFLALTWVEELIRHLFIVVIYVGAAAVMRKRMHPGVEALTQALPAHLKPFHDVYAGICSLTLSTVVAYVTWALLVRQKTIGVETVATEIPMYIVTTPMFVGFALMALYSVRDIVGAIRDLRVARGGDDR